jgi:mannosyltransferase
MPVAVVRRRVPELAVTALVAAVASWRVDVPSPWRDEGATWMAAGRSLPDLFALTRTVDLVHLPYYLLAHAVLAVDDSILALRLLSVVATALTGGLLVALGRRLGSVRVGVTAGLALAVSPLASRYGQEARPYALAALAASLAALALARATDPDARRWAWQGGRAWWLYGLAVVATGLVNVLALLVVAGHAVFVLTSRRSALRRWAVSTAGALAVLGPFVAATSRQAGQVGWLTRPTAHDLAVVLEAPFGPGLTVVAGVAAATGVAPVAGGLRGLHRPAVVLGAGWGVLPPVLLWLVSQGHPLFDGRYAVAALPGTCLALAGLTPPRHPHDQGKGRAAAPAVVLVLALAVIGWPAHQGYRDPASGHAEDVRGALRILVGQARPGDAVLFVPYHLRIVTAMAPGLEPALDAVLGAVPDDVALGRDRIASASMAGEDVTAAEVPTRLAGRTRVWLLTDTRAAPVATPADRAKLALLETGYIVVRREQVTHFTVTLHERS